MGSTGFDGLVKVDRVLERAKRLLNPSSKQDLTKHRLPWLDYRLSSLTWSMLLRK